MSDSRLKAKKSPVNNNAEVSSDMLDVLFNTQKIREQAVAIGSAREVYTWWRNLPIIGPFIKALPEDMLFRKREGDFDALTTDLNNATCAEDVLRGFVNFFSKGAWEPTSGNTDLMKELMQRMLTQYDFSGLEARKLLNNPAKLQELCRDMVVAANEILEGSRAREQRDQELAELPKINIKSNKAFWDKSLAAVADGYKKKREIADAELKKKTEAAAPEKTQTSHKMDPAKLAEMHALIGARWESEAVAMAKKKNEIEAARSMTVEELRALSREKKIKLPGSILAKLPIEDLEKLPAEVIMFLPVERMRHLKPAKLAELTPWTMRKLPEEVQALIPLDLVRRYKATPDNFVQMPVGVLDRFPLEELMELPQKAFYKLPGQVLAKLSQDELMKLPSQVIETLPSEVRNSLPLSGGCTAAHIEAEDFVAPGQSTMAERKRILSDMFKGRAVETDKPAVASPKSSPKL